MLIGMSFPQVSITCKTVKSMKQEYTTCIGNLDFYNFLDAMRACYRQGKHALHKIRVQRAGGHAAKSTPAIAQRVKLNQYMGPTNLNQVYSWTFPECFKALTMIFKNVLNKTWKQSTFKSLLCQNFCHSIIIILSTR